MQILGWLPWQYIHKPSLKFINPRIRAMWGLNNPPLVLQKQVITILLESDFFLVQFYSWFKFYFLHFWLIIITYQTQSLGEIMLKPTTALNPNTYDRKSIVVYHNQNDTYHTHVNGKLHPNTNRKNECNCWYSTELNASQTHEAIHLYRNHG